MMNKLFLMGMVALFGLHARAQQKGIVPGAVWTDQLGQQIQAHGGAITQFKGSYYWYGETYTSSTDSGYKSVNCYTSKDLINWRFRGNVLHIKSPDPILYNWTLERPKVYFNKKKRKSS
jgi:hypothetical protein